MEWYDYDSSQLSCGEWLCHILQVYIVRAHECTNQDDENPVAEVESNAEETPKEVKKRGKKNYSRKSKKEKSSPVLATRRSLRRKWIYVDQKTKM